jgi:hypothetical protein
MPGPIDFNDPAALYALFPGRFADPNAAPASPPAPGSISIPGVGPLPPALQQRFANSQTAPANANGAGPPPASMGVADPFGDSAAPPSFSLPGLGPLPPELAGKFAAPPPPDEAPIKVDAKTLAKQQAAATKQQSGADAALRARAADPFARAADMQQQGLAKRQEAAAVQADAEMKEGDAEAKAYADANVEADKQRAAAEAQAKQDAADQQRLRGDLDQAQKAYADSKVDPNRFWHDKSTGQKILAGIGIALSGLGAAMNHEGVNPALQLILDAVKQDVSLQMADREHLGTVAGMKGSALDRMVALTRDHAAASQAAIAGALGRVDGQIKQIAAQTKSDTAKSRLLDFSGTLQMAAGEAADKAATGAWNRVQDQKKLALEKQQVAIAGGHLALAGKQFEYTQKKDALERGDRLFMQAQNDAQEAQKQALAAKVASAKAAGATPEQLKTLQEIDETKREQTVYAPPVVTKDPKTGELKPTAVVVANKDGTSPFSTTAAKALKPKIAAAMQYSTLVDQLVEWRKEHGWESSAWNSSDRQQAQALLGNLKIAAKNAFQLGAISGSDNDLLNDAIGTGDPGSVRDPTDALLTGRKAQWDSINTEAIAGGYDGHERIELKPVGTVDAQNSPGQKLRSDVEDLAPKGYVNPDDYSTTEGKQIVTDSLKAGQRPPSTTSIAALNQLVMAAQGRLRDVSAEDAAQKLLDIANNDNNPALRKYARDTIDKLKPPGIDPWWQDPGRTLGFKGQ